MKHPCNTKAGVQSCRKDLSQVIINQAEKYQKEIYRKNSSCSKLLVHSQQRGLIVKMQTHSCWEQPVKYLLWSVLSWSVTCGSRWVLPLPLREEQKGDFRKDEAEMPPLGARLPTCHLKIICRTHTWLGQGDKYIETGTMSGHWDFAFQRPHRKLALSMFWFYFLISPSSSPI